MKQENFDLEAKYKPASPTTALFSFVKKIPWKGVGTLSAIFAATAPIGISAAFTYRNICSVETVNSSPYETPLNHNIKLKSLQDNICNKPLMTVTDYITNGIEASLPSMQDTTAFLTRFSAPLPL